MRKLKVGEGCVNVRSSRGRGGAEEYRGKEERKRRDWQKRVEGRLGAREQWNVCVTEKTHYTQFTTP